MGWSRVALEQVGETTAKLFVEGSIAFEVLQEIQSERDAFIKLCKYQLIHS